jgi:hypothetical protein
VFDTFTAFDRVGEHAFDTIDPSDQVARSGWAGLVGSDRIALDDEAGGWSGGFHRHRTKADVDGLARMSAMLSRKMLSLVEAIELHKEP